MTAADWRALIEAYLEARISAEAFARRFLEAWTNARQAGAPPPRAIAELQVAVEAFAAEADERDEGQTNDDDLRDAARRARAGLSDAAPMAGGPRTYDRARAQEDMRRIQIQMSGCAGMGCLVAIIWIALCLLQIFAVSDQIQNFLDWPAAPATFAGVVIAFVPVVGNAIAFFGAMDVWGWSPLLAAVVFFAAPAATMLTGWMRWRRYRR